jgi:hypothetical protein
MYVDREGGAISLQLAETLGSIRTGAVQTAAELALVRLKEERIACVREIGAPDSMQRAESLCIETKKDLLSESELASVQAQETEIKAMLEREERFMLRAQAFAGVITVIAAIWLWIVTDGFFNILWAFIWKGFLWVAAYGIGSAIIAGIQSSLREPGASSDELADKVRRHQIHLKHLAELSRLTEAHAKLAQIDEDIARNDKIVRQR